MLYSLSVLVLVLLTVCIVAFGELVELREVSSVDDLSKRWFGFNWVGNEEFLTIYSY